MSWKNFLLGLLVLLITPVLVVMILGLWVFYLNGRPQASALKTRVSPQIVLPWQDSLFSYEFYPEGLPKPEPKPVDIAFLIDVSGSMRDDMPAMALAARDMAEALNEADSGLIRYGLIRFDTLANIDIAFTGETDKLFQGLQSLEPFTGGNNPTEMFKYLERIEETVRPGARKVAVFYTDGVICTDGPTTQEQAADRAAAFRTRGWEFFSVGVPGEGSAGLMSEITGSPERVFSPRDEIDFRQYFGLLGNAIANALGLSPKFSTPFDGRHFKVPLDHLPWSLDSEGRIFRRLTSLPVIPLMVSHPIRPKSAGLWNAGREAARLDYLDVSGAPQIISAVRRPKLLVITWAALLLALLPALLWCLYKWPIKKAIRILGDRPVLLSKKRPKPVALPPLPLYPQPRVNLVPTLFVGLGETGHLALDGLSWELEQADSGFPSVPYRFLHLDLAEKALPVEPPFHALERRNLCTLLPPNAVLKSYEYLPKSAQPNHLKWFPGHEYIDRARSALDFSGRDAKSDRVLARLALFKWLEKSDLVSQLNHETDALMKLSSVDGVRQIVIFSSWHEGFGSGCAIDIARIFQRLCRDLQAGDALTLVPEIMLVLCDEKTDPSEPNRQALTNEIQTATLTAAHPQRTVYLPGHPALDRIDRESPFHRTFSVDTYKFEDLAAQCGELAVILTERLPRAGLLNSSKKAVSSGPVAISAHGLHILPNDSRDRVTRDILLRLMGGEILVDFETDHRGGYKARSISRERAEILLAEFTKSEPAGTPLQLCLAATQGGPVVENLAQRLEATWTDSNGKIEAVDWEVAARAIEKQFIRSVSEKLHGYRSALGWHRGWTPNETLAVLTLIDEKFQNLFEHLTQEGNSYPARILERLGRAAGGAAGSIRTWFEAFESNGTRFVKETQTAEGRHRLLKGLSQRTYLTPHESLEKPGNSVNDWVGFCLKVWLNTSDTLSPLREHLYFELRQGAAEGSVIIVLNQCLEGEEQFSDAEPAIQRLMSIAARIATRVPGSTIGGALSLLKEEKIRQLGRGLLNRDSSIVGSLVLIPDSASLPLNEKETLNQIEADIFEPAGQGEQKRIYALDQSAIRRLLLARAGNADGFNDAFAQAGDKKAEILRQTIERALSVRVASLPGLLRLALADDDAFAAFCNAYRAGQIRLTEDELGQSRWTFQGKFLSDKEKPDLAEAAANFGFRVPVPYATFPYSDRTDLFQTLDDWLLDPSGDSREALTLAAIRVQGKAEGQNP